MLTINNAFSITLAQRTRSSPCCGRSARLAASCVVGRHRGLDDRCGGRRCSVVIAGFGVATASEGVFEAFGGALPAGGLTVRPLAVGISILVGVVMPFVAAQLPARRAAAVPPVAALREVEHESRGGLRRRAGIGAGRSSPGRRQGSRRRSAAGRSPGARRRSAPRRRHARRAPAVMRPAAGVSGAVLGRVRGVNGRFAAQNARRNPRRSASTATALVVGIAVVVADHRARRVVEGHARQ